MENINDEFRRLQESRRNALSEDAPQLYWRGCRSLSESARRTLATTIKGLLATNNGVHAYQWTNLTGKGNTFRITQVNPGLFHDVFEVCRTFLENGELVDLHNDYSECKCFLTDDGFSGFAIEPNGNLISVFSLNGSYKQGFLYSIKDFVVEQGATHCDCYDSILQPLPFIYQKTIGFKSASRMGYNMAFDHDDIAENHGRPDIVFMVSGIHIFEERRFGPDEYDEAKAYQQEALKSPLGYYENIIEQCRLKIDRIKAKKYPGPFAGYRTRRLEKRIQKAEEAIRLLEKLSEQRSEIAHLRYEQDNLKQQMSQIAKSELEAITATLNLLEKYQPGIRGKYDIIRKLERIRVPKRNIIDILQDGMTIVDGEIAPNATRHSTNPKMQKAYIGLYLSPDDGHLHAFNPDNGKRLGPIETVISYRTDWHTNNLERQTETRQHKAGQNAGPKL